MIKSIFIILLFHQIVFSQSTDSLLNTASVAADSGNYYSAIDSYRKLLNMYIQNESLNKEYPSFMFYYEIGKCFSNLKQTDSAFFYLNLAIAKGYFALEIFTDADNFYPLSKDKRWDELFEKSNKKYSELYFCKDIFINLLLRDMYRKDQFYRNLYFNTILTTQQEKDSIYKIMIIADSVNQINIIPILDSYSSNNDSSGCKIKMDYAFFIIQHSSLELQKKYFSVFEKAVKKGDLQEVLLHYLIDRILVNEGKPQRYGTQYIKDEQGKLILAPIEKKE